jgi:hypothetical protein
MKPKKRSKESQPKATVIDPPRESLKKVAPSVTVSLLLFLGVVIYLGTQLSQLVYINKHKDMYFYDQHIPIMATPDSYYYLRLTSDLLNDKYDTLDELRPGCERPHPIPLIVSISALMHRISGIPVEQIAFYLPLVLASLMIIVYLLWGYELGGPAVALVTLLAGASSSYWCYRTRLGFFDTDCLNPVFFFLIIFCVYRFASIQSRQRFLYLVAALALSFLFRLWWVPGGHLGLLAIALTYATSFLVASSKGERLVKVGLLATVSFAGLLMLLVSMGFVTSFFSRYWKPVTEYFELIRNPDSLFPNVGQSISELAPLSLRELGVLVSGNEVPFMLSMVGLVLLFMRKKEVINFLLPGLLFGIGSLFSQRFVVFFVPVYGIGIGYLLGEFLLKGKYLQAIHRPFWRLSLWSLILVGLLSPGFYRSLSQHPGQCKTAYDVVLVRSFAEKISPQSVIWAWWDAGYFLQYLTGRKTIIDGGSQSPQRTYIAAYPLACENVTLARNWIRFFADHNPDDLGTLVSHLGDVPKAMAFLREALGNPAELESVLAKHELQDPVFWRRYLFPEVEVCLFLDYATLSIGPWWHYFGTWDFEQQSGKKPELFYPLSKTIMYFEQSGVVIDDNFVFKADRVISIGSPSGGDVNKVKDRDFRGRDRNDGNSLAGLAQNKKLVYKPESAVILNFRSHREQHFLVDGKFMQSLVCRLLLRDPYDTNQFSPLVYLASDGGAWRVE